VNPIQDGSLLLTSFPTSTVKFGSQLSKRAKTMLSEGGTKEEHKYSE
jgi:hypothetical protein